jgi:release factor glutamine methyltransferase
MTLAERLQQAESQLRAGPHPERARRDAESLLMHHLGKSRAWLLAHLHDECGGCTAIGYAALLDRRFRGEPIQYITGETEFYGLPFGVTPDVLIPRPETEHLVEQVVRLAANFAEPRIVDIGTGSGAICIALAHQLRHAVVTAIDLSECALSIARENAERNGVAERICFLRGDLLSPVTGGQFDLIVSNPPYVPETDKPTLSVEVRYHEPALALFAGSDGLGIYRRLIPAACAALAPGGFIALEIGYGQQTAIDNLLSSSGFKNIAFHPDFQSIPRVAIAER